MGKLMGELAYALIGWTAGIGVLFAIHAVKMRRIRRGRR
jgi:hypothetical protein